MHTQPRHRVRERSAKPRSMPRPRNGGRHYAMSLAIHPRCLRPDVRFRTSKIAAPPIAQTASPVIGNRFSMAYPATALLALRGLCVNDNRIRFGVVGDVLHDDFLRPDEWLNEAFASHCDSCFLILSLNNIILAEALCFQHLIQFVYPCKLPKSPGHS